MYFGKKSPTLKFRKRGFTPKFSRFPDRVDGSTSTGTLKSRGQDNAKPVGSSNQNMANHEKLHIHASDNSNISHPKVLPSRKIHQAEMPGTGRCKSYNDAIVVEPSCSLKVFCMGFGHDKGRNKYSRLTQHTKPCIEIVSKTPLVERDPYVMELQGSDSLLENIDKRLKDMILASPPECLDHSSVPPNQVSKRAKSLVNTSSAWQTSLHTDAGSHEDGIWVEIPGVGHGFYYKKDL